MNLSEYNPKPYLLVELPYSKVIMDHPEAIQLEKPVGAFIVPKAVWCGLKSEYTIDQMKVSGELTSTIAADGTEWFDCPNAIPLVRSKHTSWVSNLPVSPRLIHGLCACCGATIYDDLIKCDGCDNVVCDDCTQQIAGYIFCTDKSCVKGKTHWSTMRDDGLNIETAE